MWKVNHNYLALSHTQSLVSKCRQLLSSLQTTEVNLLQTMSPPAGNQGNAVILPEVVVGGVDPAQQQKRCRELQQDCKRFEIFGICGYICTVPNTSLLIFFNFKDNVGAEDTQQSPSNKPHPPGAAGVRDARPARVGRRHEGCAGGGGRGRNTATQSQISGVFWWVM